MYGDTLEVNCALRQMYINCTVCFIVLARLRGKALECVPEMRQAWFSPYQATIFLSSAVGGMVVQSFFQCNPVAFHPTAS